MPRQPHLGSGRPSLPSRRTLGRVRAGILEWYATEHRDFPWRETRDAYAVLVSEVMLQQTQASRVQERFPRFLARFPSVETLAEASAAEVLAEWSGLGYNRRALALHRVAVAVSASGWPTSVAELERLPGIGPYTSRAVASLAFGEPVGVVDTNVRRWLVRRFGLEPDGARARPAGLQALADGLARMRHRGRKPGAEEVAAWTHASMELGGRICTTRRPACDRCPVARGCPSRDRAVRVPVARQPSFDGSSRAARGALLRALAQAPRRRLASDELRARLGTLDGLEAALATLERDGLVHRSSDLVRLGPAPELTRSGARGAAATIGR